MTPCRLGAALVSLIVLVVAGTAAAQLFTPTPAALPVPDGFTRRAEMKIQLPGLLRLRLIAEVESDFGIGNADVASEEER